MWPWPRSSHWNIDPDSQLSAGKTEYLYSLATATPPRGPNVLLILADDLGRHEVSFMGHGPMLTPHIDALAAQGVVYSNAYATAAICAPSRAALLTGRLQNRYGFESQPMQRYVRNLGEYLGFRYLIDTDEMQPFLSESYPDPGQLASQGLPSSEITLAEVFQARGYRTGIFGKWHLGYSKAKHPLNFGFDEQYGFIEAFSLYAEGAGEDIVEHRHDLFWERHIWEMGRSGPSAITRNSLPVSEHRYLTDAIVAETKAFIGAAVVADQPFFAYVPFSAPHTPFQARKADYQAFEGISDHNQRVYLAMIHRLDQAVGELVGYLETQGVRENTLIVFTSDNGGASYTGATDNGPLRGGKFTQFEGGLAVPLVVSRPQSTPGRDERLVLLTDLFSTLLGEVGIPLPADRRFDSLPLAGALTKRALIWRSDFNRAIRSGKWKLLHNKQSGSSQLFDLSLDPGELHNRADQEPLVLERLQQTMDAWELEMDNASWPRVMNYLYRDELGAFWFAI